MTRAAFALALLLASPVWAYDDGRYAQVDPELKRWIEGLTDLDGHGCCATADGFKPEGYEWDIGGDGYNVMIDGTWYKVPRKAEVTEPNRLGHAMVWYFIDSGQLHIRCFLPGAGG